MSTTNNAGVQELGDRNADGTRLGKASTGKIGFLGATPITQRSGGTDAPSTRPSGIQYSTLVASVESIAVAAASLANANAATLAAFGLTT